MTMTHEKTPAAGQGNEGNQSFRECSTDQPTSRLAELGADQ